MKKYILIAIIASSIMAGYGASIYKKDTETKQHWFCLVYSGTSLNGNSNCTGSMYSGKDSRKVTKRQIDAHKKDAGMDTESVLISCSYLGLMTYEEFVGE